MDLLEKAALGISGLTLEEMLADNMEDTDTLEVCDCGRELLGSYEQETGMCGSCL